MWNCLFTKKLLLLIINLSSLRLSIKEAKDNPWITTGLKESITRKHLLYQKFVFDSSENNKVVYKVFKNKLRSVIRKAETDYYKNVFKSKTQSMKDMWKEVGNLLNTKKKSKRNSISILIMNNQEITKDKDIANAITKIGKNLADKVRPERNHSFKVVRNKKIEIFFSSLFDRLL